MKTINLSKFTSKFNKANGAKLMSKFKSIPPVVYILAAVVVVIGLAFWFTDDLGWLLLFGVFVLAIGSFFFPRHAVSLVKELDTRMREHWKVVRECAADAWKIVSRKGSGGSGTTAP